MGQNIIRGIGEGGVFSIDYFCDRQANIINSINGIPVIDCKELEGVVKKSGKRATIIICVGTKKFSVLSIYNDLVKHDIEADVFDYFENDSVFSDTSFMFNGKEYELFEHSFNCGYVDTRMTERSVELALAKEWLNCCSGDVTEVGAVTPYYFYDNRITEVVDPTDLHSRVSRKKSLFECDFKGKNILSISTVEHVGTHDYGMSEEKNVIDAIAKIVEEAKSFLITAPLGYNKLLDDWIRRNSSDYMIKILGRGINNHWDEIELQDYHEIVYGPLWAQGLVVIANEYIN